MARIIFHVDCDYFFAQIEELRNPSLKGKPVAVCVYSGRTPDSGAVGTANYEARKLGIHSGMPIAFAKKKAGQETVFLPVDMDYYKKISQKIMHSCTRISGKTEQASIDEAFLDVSQECKNDYLLAEKLAQKLKKKIRTRTGITVSIGIGPNKLVAKIASGTKKPDGLTIVKESEVKKFLEPLSVEAIPGIGQKTFEKLKRIGISTIMELSKAPLPVLVQEFGKAKGNFMHNASFGIDEREVEENREKKQLSVIRTLKKDVSEVNEMQDYLKEISKTLHAKALWEKILFKTVTIIAISSTLQSFNRAKTLEKPANSLEEIFATSRALFERFFEENPQILLRRAGIGVTNFSKEEKQRRLAEF